MNRIFKTWMLWLLVLALPVQGYAAVSQLSCGPVMHQTVVEVIHDAPMHHAGAHEHHMQNLPADMDMAAAHDADAAPDQMHDQQANSTCSACAACCISIAMLPVLPDWSVIPIGATPVVSSPASLFLGHIADGIKRPPKSLLV